MDALVFNLRQEHVVICDFVSTFHQVQPQWLSGLPKYCLLPCDVLQWDHPEENPFYMHADEMLCICA